MLSDLVQLKHDEMKSTDKSKHQSNHFKASEEILLKILNIVMRYLKENVKALNWLVLKLIKWVVSAMSDEHLADVAKMVVPEILQFEGKKDVIILVK